MAITSLISCNSAADNASRDNVEPVANVFPPSGQSIGGNARIVVSFSEAMTTTSLQLTGSLASQADSVIWSKTNANDDTLNILPKNGWISGEATLLVSALDTAGNAMGSTLELAYTVDANLPGATSISIASGSRIMNDANIVVTFDESMDTSSLDLSDSLGVASDGGIWSSTINDNDTLTIGPASLWIEGDASLVINVTDMVGNLLDMNLNYTVDETPAQSTEQQPVSGSTIPKTSAVVMSFNESMRAGSETITGTIVNTDGTSVAWSDNVSIDDRMTITPISSWKVLSGTLIVNATDLAGNSFEKSINYSVDSALQCTGSADCPLALPICAVLGICVECAVDTDCPAAQSCVANACVSTLCGNGVIEATEECDGADVAGQTCISLGLGFTGGTLGCSVDCTFDTSNCTP